MKQVLRISFLVALLISAGVSLVQAQATMEKWKPNVGDKFVCAVTHYSSCGDYMCDGTDTVLFQIVDTSFTADAQHQNGVRALTRPVALNYKYYWWGHGWDSSLIKPVYTDTTLLSSAGNQTISTTFNGYSVAYRGWSQIALVADSSVVFQGVSYSAKYGADGIFVPALGWFTSLHGYGGYCTSNCIKEDWALSLIAAIKGHGGVSSRATTNVQVTFSNGLLQVAGSSISDATLLDVLGQPVRLWQLPASDGSSEVSLTIGDVAAGVYFLRVQGGGVDEVKKVCIAH